MQKEINLIALLGLVFSFLAPFVGLILSILALSQLKKEPERYSGRELAVAGLIISTVFLYIAAVMILLVLILLGIGIIASVS